MENKPPNILNQIASLVVVISAVLYFTGWIYRWAYFGFFLLEVTTLDLLNESFFMVPFYLFFGNLEAVGRTLGLIVSFVWWLMIGQLLILLLVDRWNKTRQQLSGWFKQNYHKSKLRAGMMPYVMAILELNIKSFPPPLVRDFFLIFITLIMLYNLAYNQGLADARRDAGPKSTLPVVTLVVPESKIPLGRNIRDLTLNPKLQQSRVIGDIELYEQLQRRDFNDKSVPEEQRIVWRLLLDRNGQFYIFPALPSGVPVSKSPPVVVIQESVAGDQMMIMSPEVPPGE
ncbi:hypothetical protein [[Phormidium] sp. ETS-05]|uniref:hypothetical protein n=1 Tax=[Phormidium] sp. ETS-05 TaxID=222819 RepID=UPI0018EF1F71|nr:hypothetical protein [[Phormidium] sp. ETS-05]